MGCNIAIDGQEQAKAQLQREWQRSCLLSM